jgi:thiol-disulfide isomerase/thioredoxin
MSIRNTCAGAALIAMLTAAAAVDLMEAVREAARTGNFAAAQNTLREYRRKAGVTPEWLEAESWLARGQLEAKQYDAADQTAVEVRQLAAPMAGKANSDPHRLEIALGAAIEVHAQTLAARGQRAEAVAFLNQQLAAYRQTPLAARIQKNLNLLTLVGHPAPELEESHWLGPKPQSLASLKGHPVLLFFWAHWCGDCKAEVPMLARLMATYGSRGLVLMGPTQRYGYAAEGNDATPEQETQYIDSIRRTYYAALDKMSVPVAERNFIKYGCSTTPTVVLVDSAGTVRFYHPGALSYQALADQIRRVLPAPARS